MHIIQLEIEAMSLSHLGVVYDKLLQQPDKAKEYFMRCVQLTEAMPNQSFVLQGKIIVSAIQIMGILYIFHIATIHTYENLFINYFVIVVTMVFRLYLKEVLLF